MGPLAGFSADDVIRKLQRAGFAFDRQAKGSHEIWRSRVTRARTTIPRHYGDLAEGAIAAVIRQARLTVDEFLEL